MSAIGPLMIDVGGLTLTPEDREILKNPLVGGLILFARNYSDKAQLAALCADIRATVPNPDFLIAVDHEGGRVQRFRVGFSRIPAMRTLGRKCDEDSAAACKDAFAHGKTIGSELASFDIDLCFAPVLDRDLGSSEIIGDRAFDIDTDRIVMLATEFNKGLASVGMSATGKHFPGHGFVVADSHLELPVDRRSFDEIEKTELKPFIEMIQRGIPSLMMAHILYERVDNLPASLSRKWIYQYLRRKLKFKGAVFCDDLSMNGAAIIDDVTARAEMALSAGCDMVPVCNDRDTVNILLEGLKWKVRPSSTKRLRALRRTAA